MDLLAGKSPGNNAHPRDGNINGIGIIDENPHQRLGKNRHQRRRNQQENPRKRLGYAANLVDAFKLVRPVVLSQHRVERHPHRHGNDKCQHLNSRNTRHGRDNAIPKMRGQGRRDNPR